jgi:actin-like ATPase involved in cell morphogenesis/tetratricopeptide (TPR) repeat protein
MSELAEKYDMTAPAIAIDFGTTRTKVAYYDSDRREPRLVELGRRTLTIVPSIFYIPKEGDPLVGDDAEDRLDSDPEGIIIGLKKEIHRPGEIRFGQGRPKVNRVRLASELFRFIRNVCRTEVFHAEVQKCVLTVPVTFEEQKRGSIRQAAERAGFREITIAEEPVAAAKYWLGTSGQHIADTVVVCDVGGGTTDLALLRLRDGHFVPVPDVRCGGTSLGGDNVDEDIWGEIRGNDDAANVTEFRQSAFLARLRRVKELIARDCGAQIPLAFGGYEIAVPRTVIEEHIRNFVETVVDETKRFLDACPAAVRLQDSPILLVGGASRLLGLKQALETLAPGRVYVWNYSDYATVLGAVECPASAPTTVSVPAPGPMPVSAEAESPVTAKSTQPRSTSGERESVSAPVTPTEPSAEARVLLARAKQLLEQARQGGHDASPDNQAVREQQLNAALQHAGAACDLEPRWADAFYIKAQVLTEQSESALAVAVMTACLRLNPEYPDARGRRGCDRFDCDDFAQARQDFDEEIQRRPTATWFGFRAAACARSGDAAAAVADLRSAIELSTEEASLVRLCAIAGFLMHRRLKNPAEAVPLYGQALSAISWDLTSGEVSAFTLACLRFDILKAMIKVPLPDTPGVEVVHPVASVQRHLWQAIVAIRGECDRSAVAMFVEHCGKHDVADDLIWQDAPEFCRHRADICAARGDGDGAVVWLTRLWAQRPDYDVRVIREDPGIKSAAGHSSLREILEVKLSYTEDHGALLNDVTITNESPFRLTAIEVTVLVTRKDGKQDAPIVRRLDSLAPGESHEWADVFQGGGWFGRNIGSVTVAWKCAEGVSTPAPSHRALSTSNAESRTDESFSSDVTGVRVACPHCRKGNMIAPSNVGNDFRCLHCGGTIKGHNPSSQTAAAGKTGKWDATCSHCGQPSYMMLSTGKCPHCKRESIVEAEVVAKQDVPEHRRTNRRWYYSLDGKQRQGPVSADELRALIATGVLKREHFLSNDGQLWSRADKLKGVNWP